MRHSRKGEISEEGVSPGEILLYLTIIIVVVILFVGLAKSGSPVFERVSGIVSCKQSAWSWSCLNAVFSG